MPKELIREIRPHVRLYRDPRTGLAWVENGQTGLGHSCHPNISATGSVGWMRDRGYWGRKDKVISSHGWCYNISLVVVTDDLDEIARQHCACGGNHGPTRLDQDATSYQIAMALEWSAQYPGSRQIPGLLGLAAKRLREQEDELHATRDAASEWEREQYELARGLYRPN